MKKYLLIALAALGFAACAEKMDDNSPVQKGEVESSYIAISLSATDPSTRAEGDEPQHEGTYQEGEAAERAVETAYFFFFDQNGNAFPVNVIDGAAGAPGQTDGINYLLATINPTIGADMNNVSDIKNVVLLLKNYKGDYPKQIVAVLNWVPTSDTPYSLSKLKEELVNVRNGDMQGKFVMSNAVYATEGTPATAVYATPLTADNIFTDEANAKANPVTIYVERVAAKVTVTTTGGKDVFDLNKPVTIGGSNTPVYAKILGWELYNDYQQSYLVKNIDLAWTNGAIGFTWNDSPWYRSYWATSQKAPFSNNTFSYQYASIPDGYKTEYGYGFGSETNVTAGTYADKTFTYCGENTNRDVKDRTKIILKAQLVKNQDGTGEVELARWYSTEYLGEKDLRTAVANTLKYTLYYRDGDNYVGLKPEDLQCVSPEYGADGKISNGAPSTIKSYEVFFQLSTEGQAKIWYKNVDGEKKPMADVADKDKVVAAVNAHLLNVTPATLYKSGQTYYYFDVQHLGKSGSDGEYGIVRNHIYAININSIGGYGSPIYIGTSNIVTPPEYPEEPGEETSFVSAEVRILSWRIVSHGVNIQPNPEPTPGV